MFSLSWWNDLPTEDLSGEILFLTACKKAVTVSGNVLNFMTFHTDLCEGFYNFHLEVPFLPLVCGPRPGWEENCPLLSYTVRSSSWNLLSNFQFSELYSFSHLLFPGPSCHSTVLTLLSSQMFSSTPGYKGVPLASILTSWFLLLLKK